MYVIVAGVSAAGDTPTPRGSDWPAFLAAGVGLVLLVVLSAIVGAVGAPHGEEFSWEIASIFGTALGTTLLAGATGWLAWSTRSEVRATQDLAEVTRRQQAASERPTVLLMRNSSWSGAPENGVVSVELQNVGLGPALRVNVSASYTGHSDWQPGIDSWTVPVIAPGTGVTVNLNARFPEPPDDRDVVGYAFPVTGSYLDRSMENEYPIITSWPEEDESEPQGQLADEKKE